MSLAYILLPNLLFFFGWLRLPFAIVLAVLACYGGWLAWRSSIASTSPAESLGRFSPLHAAVCLFLALMATAVSGNGGFFYQVPEHIRHATLLLELSRWTWPLGFEEIYPGSGPQPLTYYWGYYLPPALLASVAGWAAGWIGLFLWTGFGVFLILAWFLRITKAPPVRGTLLFLLFGTLGVPALFATLAVAHAIHGEAVPVPLSEIPRFVLFGNLDYWPFFAAQAIPGLQGEVIWYAGTMTRMEFGVQHLIPAWIGTLMLFYDGLVRRSNDRAGFLYAVLLVNSPFVALAATPYALWTIGRNGLLRSVSFPNAIAGVAILVVQVLYLSASDGETPQAALWTGVSIGDLLPYLLIQYAAAFGIYFALTIPFLSRFNHDLRGFAWMSLALMTVLPWYRMGHINDLAHNGAGVAQLCLLIVIAVVLWDLPSPSRWARIALVCTVCVGGIASAGMITRAVTWGVSTLIPDPDALRPAMKLTPGSLPLQSRTDTEAPFWRYLARTVSYAPVQPRKVRQMWDMRVESEREQWIAEHGHEVIDAGIQTSVPESGIFLRYTGDSFAATGGGAIEIRVRLHTPGAVEPEGGWPTFAARWSDGPPLNAILSDFFLNSLYMEPMYNRPWDETAYEGIFTRHETWRATIEELGFEIRFPISPSSPVELEVESITLYDS